MTKLSRQNIIVRPAPLPETNMGLHLRRELSLTDRVKHMLMNGGYALIKPFIEAINNNDAVHGSILMDRAEGARVLQEYAKKQGDAYVASKSRAEILRALNRSLKSILDENGQPIDPKSRKSTALAMLQQQPTSGQPADDGV